MDMSVFGTKAAEGKERRGWLLSKVQVNLLE
jgi:hypothetical protein